jgi:hypothetical protein
MKICKGQTTKISIMVRRSPRARVQSTMKAFSFKGNAYRVEARGGRCHGAADHVVEVVVRAGRGVTETDAETGICVVVLHEQRPSSKKVSSRHCPVQYCCCGARRPNRRIIERTSGVGRVADQNVEHFLGHGDAHGAVHAADAATRVAANGIIGVAERRERGEGRGRVGANELLDALALAGAAESLRAR